MRLSSKVLITMTIMAALAATGCGNVSGGGGQAGGYIGGAVGVACNAQTQAEGCYAVGAQHNRMTCDPGTNTWALLETCGAGAYCVEAANPAAPGKMTASCNAGRVATQDTATADAGSDTVVVTPPKCGDGACQSPETPATCPADCKAAGPVCGDKKCEAPENAESCAKDCAKAGPKSCVGKCGKFVEGAPCNCDPDCAKYKDCCVDYEALCGGSCTKNCADKQCGSDGCGGSCGSCGDGMVCKSGACKSGTSSSQCPNGKCEEGETEESCPQDCKTDCEGDWTLGSTFYKSQDVSQLGKPCNPKGAPKNCPDGLWITFKDNNECLCIANCAAFSGIKKGDNCTKSGSWKCLKIKATNASGNSALACVPVKWKLCTAD